MRVILILSRTDCHGPMIPNYALSVKYSQKSAQGSTYPGHSTRVQLLIIHRSCAPSMIAAPLLIIDSVFFGVGGESEGSRFSHSNVSSDEACLATLRLNVLTELAFRSTRRAMAHESKRQTQEMGSLASLPPEVALTTATMPALIASGNSGQAATTAAGSASSGGGPVAPPIARGRRGRSDHAGSVHHRSSVRGLTQTDGNCGVARVRTASLANDRGGTRALDQRIEISSGIAWFGDILSIEGPLVEIGPRSVFGNSGVGGRQ
jgi:hypothetical protein